MGPYDEKKKGKISPLSQNNSGLKEHELGKSEKNSAPGVSVEKSASPLSVGQLSASEGMIAGSELYNASDERVIGVGRRLRSIFWGSRRRKQATIGGGAAGVAISGTLLALTFFGGTGFEFIHIAQLLEKFHFSSQQSTQDDQFVEMVRYARDIPKGAFERTRMGFLGNKFADYYANLLSESGLDAAYTRISGVFAGYVVDTDQPDLAGLKDDPDALKAAIAEKYNVSPERVRLGSSYNGVSPEIEDDDWVIDATGLKFRGSYQLTYNLLKVAGLDRLSAAIGSRLMCVRASCDWHPFSNLITQRIKLAVEKWFAALRDQEQTGQTDFDAQDDSSKPSTKEPGDLAEQTGVDGALAATDAEASAAKADPSLLSRFASSIGDSLSGLSGAIKGSILGGVAGIAILCTLNTLNSQVNSLKQKEVILPLIRMGMLAMSVGNQIMNGQDVNANEMNELGTQLYGVDSEGKATSWYDSQSIQANSGIANSGVKPDPTLQDIDQGSPFSFIADIPGINEVCSGIGQAFSSVLGIVFSWTGFTEFVDGLTTAFFQGILINHISKEAADWLAGRAVNVDAVGADYGNDIDFGAALAANQQAVTAGGTQLSSSQASTIQGDSTVALNEEYQNESLPDRLFSIDDPDSLISSIFADAQPTLSGNVGMLFSHFSSIFSSIANIPKLFTKGVSADSSSTGYSYPFSTYGFSEQDIDDPVVQDPYDNANYVVCDLFSTNSATCTGDDQSGLITKAEECFGVTISEDSSGLWDVTGGGSNVDPYMSSYSNLGCNDPAPANCTDPDSADIAACNWLRVRFFVLDTETENSMGCYAGDGEACSDIGFN